MNRSLAKEPAAKKDISASRSSKSTYSTKNLPKSRFNSLTGVTGSAWSLETIASRLSRLPAVNRAPVLRALQRTHGNRSVTRIAAGIQAKLIVGQPGDIYEQEADKAADEVMRMEEPQVRRQVDPEEEEEEEIVQPKFEESPKHLIQRQIEEEEEEEEEELLQPRHGEGTTQSVTNDIEPRIRAVRGGGQPLAESERAYFEPRFGYDFSRVRVHTGAQAAESTQMLNARAYTVGQDVVFGAGKYAPETVVGRHLLAHELTHVVQQGAAVQRSPAIRTTVSGKSQMWIQRWGLSWIKEKAGRVLGGIKSIGRSTWNAVKRVGPLAVSVAKRLGKRAAILIKNYGDRVVSFLNRWGSQAIGWIKQFGIRVVGWVKKWGSRVIKWIKQLRIRGVGVPEALQMIWNFFNKMRPLNSAEIAASQQVHAPGLISYHKVRIDENSILTRINKMRAFVSFHIIHYPKTSLLPHILVHELTHVAQYEKVGSIYMYQALRAQFIGKGYSYGDLVAARKKGKRFSKFNREQQATICGDYYKAKNNKPTDYGGSEKDLKHYVDQMNSGDF